MYFSNKAYSEFYNRYGKKEIPGYNKEDLNRKVRELADFTQTDEWYMDIVKKAQDDCTNRMICEVSNKASRQSMSSVEEGIIEVFGEGSVVIKKHCCV